MMKNIQRFRKTKTNELAGMSKHALMMRMYKEMFKLLDKCEYVMKNRTQYTISEFFSVKSKCLGKVISISSYLADTTDMSADQEVGELFVKMYSHIYVNASEANHKIDIDSVIRAKNMSMKLMDIWASIPDSSRY
ncbi:flagellar protein FliS [Photobacterium galatheae]|uniref:Flagellar biosynthesis protein FliS n=1 Tax=Photobacterium galatheae TaxID=1654360 RepID=A0A066RKB3_9GAMM|nr:flagellar protein FliS [Photobacterium galatheae]KDM90885.1 hypothetical protein EA58_14085 [Photobacterium galatheae]MCM0149147.1 flagellar protein FliS [Photobacterium galatheae]